MGGKKQGGAHTPVEAPNTANSAQVMRLLHAICEGPIGGFVEGDAFPLKSIYLNNTPIQNADGSYNFKGISSLFLEGTADQPYMPGFDKTEATYGIGTEVKKNAPIVRTISNPYADELRVTVGVHQNVRVQDNGDQVPSSTDMRVSLIRAGRAEVSQVVNFNEKSSGVFFVDVVFDSLPEKPFELKVERITPDAANSKVADATTFSSYTEISNTKQSYPYTVMAGWKIDSDQFGSSVPSVSYNLMGKLIRVPVGYDPVTRTYPKLWNGEFTEAWTNNPAWVLLDILTNSRYSGLGKRMSDEDIDIAMLYDIAKYCDELVDDGFGGKEPRVTCNAYINQQRQVYDLIRDLTTTFQGYALWNGLQATFAIDKDAPPTAVYTNANVVGGEFTYQGVARKALHTAVRVSYSNKKDNYEESSVYLQNDEMVKLYGLNEKTVTAFGCDSRGQAMRMAAWFLETEMRQRETISFTLGREGLRHLPNDIVEIADNNYARTNLGGRILSRKADVVELDRDVGEAVGGTLHMTAGGKHYKVNVVAQDGRKLTLSQTVDVRQGSIWALQKTVKPRLYRTISITENAEDGTYTISALRHDVGKYSEVDSAASKLPASLRSLPRDSVGGLTTQSKDNKLLIGWDGSANSKFDHYVINIIKDNKHYLKTISKTPGITLEDLAPGEYKIKIRGVLEDGRQTDEVVRTLVIDYSITGLKTSPRLQAIQLDWTLPQTVANDVQTEIWYAESNNRDAAKKLTTLLYPQNSYTLSGVAVSDRYWFWLRLADAAGNSGEWTAAVEGRSDPSPAPIVAQLRGAIEKSSLSKALIDSLDADAASKVAAEAQARVAAIQAAAKKAADDLAAKARELGTKITVVENVNAEQARQIQAVTAAQGNTAAGLEAEKRARAEGDRAEAQARETLVGRVASAEGSINTLRETIIRNDGARAEEIRQLQAKFTIPDTRNDNRPPSWYFANHPRSTVSEFKQADVLGLGSGFAALETVVPWGDPSGGRIFQTAYLQDGTVMRRKSDTAHTYAGKGVFNYTKDLWTGWAADETVNGAQDKADAVRRVAEEAQAAANRVEADFRQFASTQAGKDGATAQRISELSASIGNLQIGGRNLIRDSAITVQNANYLIQTYTLSDNMLQEGEPVVVTIWGDLGKDREAFLPFNSNAWNWVGTMKKVSDGVYRLSATWKRSQNNPSNDRLLIYCGPNSGRTASRIDRIKLERGTVGTDWTPAPEDEAARREAALTQYQQAQAQKDAALSEEQKTLKAELSGQKARVEQSASALASLDGKVRAMYGLKVETVSGGRKVIAGLALGADGQTGDSQMLVYADKFAIVDPKSKILKSPFVVQTAGGKTQMALSGDFVADGLIHGRHIAAGQTLSSPSIEGGSLNIGSGQFTVSSDGSLVAQNAVVRGRIEGESGYFNGTIKASRIEGDVMKVVRMKKLSNTVWEALIQAEALPMMVRPDFEVRTVNPDHARRNQATAEFLVDGKRQPVSRSFETRVTSVMKDEKYNTIGVKTDYTATTSYGWYVLPRNKSVLLQLQLAENETPTTPIPCLQTAYLSPSDAEYKTLIGKMVWRRLTDYVRLKVGWLDKGMWKAVYGLPDDIYGLRLKYLTDNNPEWANGIVWMQDGTATAIKANSTANHAAAPRQYTREVNQASSSNAVILSARNDWQWMELRDVEVLVPEDRVF